MASVSNVLAVAGQLNDKQYFLDGGYPVVVPCDQTKVEDLYWAIPYIYPAARVLEYQLTVDNGTGKPQADAVHLVKVKDHSQGNTYFLLIGDNSTEADFINACNGCCGSTPSMPTVVIPTPIVQDCACADTSGNYTYIWALPQNPNSLNTYIQSAAFNGAYASPAPEAAGYSTPGAVLTWVQANWAAYGTWSLINSNTELKLVSTTTTCAMLNLALVPATYCGALPGSPTAVDGFRIGSTTTLLPGGQINISTANPQDAINAITPLLIGTIQYGGTTPTLFYTGLQLPVQFYLGSSAVSGTSFSTCSGVTWNFDIPTDVGNYNIGSSAGAGTNAKFNGSAASPSSASTSLAAAADVLTWVQANWAAYGTWSLQSSNTILRLVSNNVFTADLVITSA